MPSMQDTPRRRRRQLRRWKCRPGRTGYLPAERNMPLSQSLPPPRYILSLTLQIPPIPTKRNPRINASYRNIRRISPFSVPMESRIPISSIRSLTDIIITLKILTAATRRENPADRHNKRRYGAQCRGFCRKLRCGIPDPDNRGFRISVKLRIDCRFYVTDVVNIVDYDIYLAPFIFPAILVGIPVIVHNDAVVR